MSANTATKPMATHDRIAGTIVAAEPRRSPAPAKGAAPAKTSVATRSAAATKRAAQERA